MVKRTVGVLCWTKRESGRRRYVWPPALLAVVGLACAAAARGLWIGRRWGRRLAIALLAVNLIGDGANVVFGTEPRALAGIPIVVLLLLFLATGCVRANFAERPAGCLLQ